MMQRDESSEPALSGASGGTAGPPVLFFDGVCNLCNRTVSFVMEHDRSGRIRFASLQSAYAEQVLRPLGIEPGCLESIVYLHKGQALRRSDAVLAICRDLRAPWRWLQIFWIMPRPLRDILYGWVARRRYKWFGKRPSCRIPTPAERDRFLG